MRTLEPDTDELLRLAADGQSGAADLLLDRHRDRLRRMVAVRMDARLATRFDPSDVVQETLAVAARRLPEYLRERTIPFYSWLRQLAWDRLAQLRQYHLDAQRRSVSREQAPDFASESIIELAERLAGAEMTPSASVVRQEMRDRVRSALDRLRPRDREVLVLRFLEQLTVTEIAAELGITEAAVGMRQLRALERLQHLVSDDELAGGT